MKTIFNIQLFFILLALTLFPVSCADVETEASGYASVKLILMMYHIVKVGVQN